MKKAQELSLNMIVVGALALLVLLLIGGVLMFGGGDILQGLSGMGASQEEVSLTSFRSTCASKCRIMNQLVSSYDSINAQNLNQVKNFCCESYDLDSSGLIELQGSMGPEICSAAYTECRLSGRTPANFCQGSYTGTERDFMGNLMVENFDFTTPEGCGLN